MKKPVTKKKAAALAGTKPGNLAPLIAEVRQLIQSARLGAASIVNTLQVMTNFEIGRRIVEFEQKGEKRAEYGAELLKELSTRLTEEFGKGFSRANLQNMRTFFLLWQDRVPKICQQPIGKLEDGKKSQQLAGKSLSPQISQTPSDQLGHVRLPEENPTIGLLLSKEKKNAVVELTLPKDANIHAREYKLYLLSKELLKKKLLEWTRAEEARRA